MSLESIFRLSVIVSMVDRLSSPMSRLNVGVDNSSVKLQQMSQTFGTMAKTGVAMAGIGSQITSAVMEPVQATFATKKALGELSSLGIKDLGALDKAAQDFSGTWAGTTKPEFITAAYDIKSGIASLSDEGVAGMTRTAALTAKATKSTAAEMTSLFASGYGIYKGYYSKLSDLDFGEMFSAGIARSVKNFKTTGSGMAQSIQTLGGSATTANVPLEEQLSILGMLQATMGGAEAGTKYKAFIRSAVKGGQELGLSFVDANNNLLSMPQILSRLRGKFGETMDAAEKMKLQEAFGDTEAVALIDLLYNKTGDLQTNILDVYGAMGQGIGLTTQMATSINSTEPDKFTVIAQKVQNVKEQIGTGLLPIMNRFLDASSKNMDKLSEWISQHQQLTNVIMIGVGAFGAFLTIGGTAIAICGMTGLIFTKLAMAGKGIYGLFGKVKGGLDTIRIMGMYAGDGMKVAFGGIKSFAGSAASSIGRVAVSMANMAKTAAINGANALKSMVVGLVGMARQAITTAVTALPGLIAGVWSFTAALLANPITWVVVLIIGLIAALILLWQNWDAVVSWLQGAWSGFVGGIQAGFAWIRSLFAGMPLWLQIAVAAFFPLIGIPMLLINHWGSIVGFFSGMWNKAADIFRGGVNGIKNIITGTFSFFAQSGKKIVETLTGGIKSVINHPAEAIKGAFAKVRKLLPFSDAKEGPLSTLTLSGRRVLETVSTGINQAQGLPAQAVQKSFSKVKMSLEQKPIGKIGNDHPIEKSTSTETKTDKDGIYIENLNLMIDPSKIKTLEDMKTFVHQIEEYLNSNKKTPEPEGA